MESVHTVIYNDQYGVERRLVIRLEDASAIPRFEQLRGQLSVMVAVGRLLPAARLPTVRELAQQVEMAPGTVARAYRELEADGIVIGRGRLGTFVVDEPPHSEVVQERRERADAAAERFVFELRQLGVSLEAGIEALTDAYARVVPDAEVAPGD